MAKISFNPAIDGIAGRLGKMVFFKVKHSFFGYIREYVYPKLTEQNAMTGKIMKNLAAIWDESSNDYKHDFRTYAEKYNALGWETNRLETRANSGFALFVKAMYAWGKTEDPVLDLSTLTFEDIGTLGGKVETVSNCVSYGFLPAVEGWESLDGEI